MRVRYGNHIHKKWEMEIYLQECLHVLNQLFFINLHGSFNYKESRFIIIDTVFMLILDFNGEIIRSLEEFSVSQIYFIECKYIVKAS